MMSLLDDGDPKQDNGPDSPPADRGPAATPDATVEPAPAPGAPAAAPAPAAPGEAVAAPAAAAPPPVPGPAGPPAPAAGAGAPAAPVEAGGGNAPPPPPAAADGGGGDGGNGGNGGGENRVQPNEILQATGLAGSEPKIGTFTQRAGLKLAAGVGSLAIVVTLLIVYKWMTMSPAPPNLGFTLNSDQLKALTDANQALHNQAYDAASKLFDSVVTKALLPVFTSILGYIFGAKGGAAEQSG